MDYQTGISVVDKYALHYYRKLRSSGFNVAFEDVISELGFAYAKAAKAYLPGDTAFRTLAIECFQNQIKDFVAKLSKERAVKGIAIVDRIDDEARSCESMLLEAENVSQMTRKILRKFKGQRLLIAKEYIDPSDKVRAYLNAYVSKYSCYTGKIKGTGFQALAEALSAVYGWEAQQVKSELRKIRLIAKKTLTFLLRISKY